VLRRIVDDSERSNQPPMKHLTVEVAHSDRHD
jgi:hypothetical protein